jgi:hypothetical protein
MYLIPTKLIVPEGNVSNNNKVSASHRIKHDENMQQLSRLPAAEVFKAFIPVIEEIKNTNEFGVAAIGKFPECWDAMSEALTSIHHFHSVPSFYDLTQLTVDGSLARRNHHSQQLRFAACDEEVISGLLAPNAQASARGFVFDPSRKIFTQRSDTVRDTDISRLGVLQSFGVDTKTGVVTKGTELRHVRNLVDGAAVASQTNAMLLQWHCYHLEGVQKSTGMSCQQLMEVIYPHASYFHMETYYAWQRVLYDVVRDIIKQLVNDEVQLGVTCSQMLESLNLLVDEPKSIFQYSCAVAGLPETLRVMMGQPESIGVAAFLILARSGGGSGRDEVSTMTAQLLLMSYQFEDPAVFFAQAEIMFKVLNGFGRARGYTFNDDEVNAPLFTVNYQKMWCLSKIEACLVRHRQEGSTNANAPYVMEIYHLMKAEFDKDRSCYGDLLGFTAEFSRRLNATLFKGAGSSTVINVNAANVRQQPQVPSAFLPSIPRSKESPANQLISILKSYADFNKLFVWLDASKTKCRLKQDESKGGLMLMRVPDLVYKSWPPEVKDALHVIRSESIKFYKAKYREEKEAVRNKADPIDGQVKKKRQDFHNKNKKNDSVNNKKGKIDPDTVVNAADFAAYQSSQDAYRNTIEKRMADMAKALEKANSSHAGGSNAAGSN